MASAVKITSSSTTELLKNSSFHQKFYDLNKDIPAACAKDSEDIIKEKCKSAVKRISRSSSIFLVAHEDDEDDIILPGNCTSRGDISHHDSGK